MPSISIIIPAHNAAATLNAALASVRAQSSVGWHAVIVDDGSLDATAELALRHVASDSRIELIQQEQAGASAARNTGLSKAVGEWVVFLDADDTLPPGHLERMLKAAAVSTSADVVHCGWRRVAEGHPWREPHVAKVLHNPMIETARACPFAIHAALVRRRAIERSGDFDPHLKIAEDWDLWQRIARSGGRFVPVPGHLVDVQVNPGSLSSNTAQHLADGLTVIRRGHGRDLRLAQPMFPEGAPLADLPRAITWFATWIAGAAIGRGEDVAALMQDVKPTSLDVQTLAAIFEDGMAIGAGPSAPPSHRRWGELEERVAAFAEWLVSSLGDPTLRNRFMIALETRLAAAVPAGEEAFVGRIAVVTLDPAKIIETRELPGCERARVSIVAGAKEAARFETVSFGALSSTQLLAKLQAYDSVALRKHTLSARLRQGPFGLGLSPTTALKQYLRALRSSIQPYRHRHAKLPHQDVLRFLYRAAPPGSNGIFAERRLREIVEEERRSVEEHKSAAIQQPNDEAWTAPDYTRQEYWEEVFRHKDPWDYRNAYETVKYEQTIDLIRDIRITDALEIACAEGEFTRHLAAHCKQVLATDISPTAVSRAAQSCAGLANCAFQCLDLLSQALPRTFDLIVASEVLYYLDAANLAAFANTVARHLNPGGIFLTAHANLIVDEPDRTGFGWPHPVGAKGIGEFFAGQGEFVLETELWTPLYRIFRFRKSRPLGSPAPVHLIADASAVLPDRVATQVRWRGGRELPESESWRDFPILMYHRIATDGPAELDRWRTTPETFEEQLAYLKAEGWRGVSLPRLAQAVLEGMALPDRSVMLTFDDATRDFLDAAVPLLHRYGFPATLFVPTQHVGGTAAWDAVHGAPAALLTWDQLRMLRHCDVAIGAHGVTHRALPSLDAETVVRELAGARFRLESELEIPVTSVAYPYGAFEPAIRNVAFEVGYKLGFTCFDGLIAASADPMVLHRREVYGHIGRSRFAALVQGL